MRRILSIDSLTATKRVALAVALLSCGFALGCGESPQRSAGTMELPERKITPAKAIRSPGSRPNPAPPAR